MARRTNLKSFAQIAIENGLATEDEIEECLRVQQERQAEGGAAPDLEQLVLEIGVMTETEVRAVKTALGRLARDEAKGETQRIGGYEIIGKLGGGGLGTVYKARQISMGRVVALKVLHKKWLKDEEFKKRFLLEARLVGRLSHQNLIQVFDVGKEAGSYYFSMEYIDGRPVEDIIDHDGPMPVDQALDITNQILRAVTYIWRHKIVHRDIKPGNIMMTKSGIAKLGDFGFVKSKFDAILSTEGEVLGTPDYISPEQAMGEDDIDFRSDIYSLGASLYHMVTGDPPFDGSGSTVMRKHIKAELPSPKEINLDIPDSVCHIIEKMMAKDPGDRYQDIQALFDDIEMVKLGHDPVSKRLEAGKSTIIRAFKLEHSRRDRLENQTERLRAELTQTRKMLYVTIGLLAVVTIALIFILLMGD